MLRAIWESLGLGAQLDVEIWFYWRRARARCESGYGISHTTQRCVRRRKGAHGVRSGDLINCEVRIKLLPERPDKVLNLFLTILLRRTYILVLLFLAYIWSAFSLFSWGARALRKTRDAGGIILHHTLCDHFGQFLCARTFNFYKQRHKYNNYAGSAHGVFNEKRIIWTGREREKAGALNFLDWSPLLIAPTAVWV